MNPVTLLLVRAKHWQVFAVAAGFLLLGGIIAVRSLFNSIKSTDLSVPLGFATVNVLTMCIFGIWLYSVGTFLNSRVEPSLRLATGFFRFALVYLPVYLIAFISRFPPTSGGEFLSILRLHLFGMFCLFYVFYFVSKSLVLAERGKPVTFDQYLAPLFSIWFFLIGIWFIQPRINRQYVESRRPN